MSVVNFAGDPNAPCEHEQGRRSLRNRYALKTIRAEFVWRGTNLVVRLLSVPIAIRFLGNERYGLWLTASSVVAWLNLSEMGLGGGLVNELGKASGKGDRDLMRRHVSTAYSCFLVISLVALCAVVAGSFSPVIYKLLGVQHSPNLFNDARNVFLANGFLIAATLCVNVIVPVCQGLQQMFRYLSSFSLASVATLGMLGLAFWFKASLPVFSLLMGLPAIAMAIVVTFRMFTVHFPYLRPQLKLFDVRSFRALVSYGGPLLVVQCCDLLIYNSSSPLIAWRLGVSAVPRYAISLALLMTVVNACDGIVRAYLGGYCEAVGRGDWPWIRSVAIRTRVITFAIMAVTCLVAVIAGPFVIRIWAGAGVVPSRALLASLCVYCFAMVCSHTNYVLLLGLGNVRLKAGCELFIAAAHIFGYLALVPRFGLLALPMAGTVGYAVDIIFSYSYTHRFLGIRLNRDASGERPGVIAHVATILRASRPS